MRWWPFPRRQARKKTPDEIASIGAPQPQPYVPSAELPCCPLMGGPCLKEKCALYVTLEYDVIEQSTQQRMKKEIGKCALTWLPTLSAELRATVDTLRAHPHP